MSAKLLENVSDPSLVQPPNDLEGWESGVGRSHEVRQNVCPACSLLTHPITFLWVYRQDTSGVTKERPRFVWNVKMDWNSRYFSSVETYLDCYISINVLAPVSSPNCPFTVCSHRSFAAHTRLASFVYVDTLNVSLDWYHFYVRGWGEKDSHLSLPYVICHLKYFDKPAWMRWLMCVSSFVIPTTVENSVMSINAASLVHEVCTSYGNEINWSWTVLMV